MSKTPVSGDFSTNRVIDFSDVSLGLVDSCMIVGQDQSSLLDNPVWNALSTTHASLAEGDELAKRYPVDVAPFAATRDQSPESYRSLARLLGPEGTAAIPLATMPILPDGWTVVRKIDSAQMVWNTQTPPPAEHSFEELKPSHVDEMLALVELTKPGPFLKRTPELGSYLGIREAGQLVAMAGERLKPYGYTEISCLHPSRLPGARIRQLTSLHSDAEDRKME